MKKRKTNVVLLVVVALLMACVSTPPAGERNALSPMQTQQIVDSIGKAKGIGRIWTNEDSLIERPYTDRKQIERDVEKMVEKSTEKPEEVKGSDRLIDMQVWDSIASHPSREGSVQWQSRMNDSLYFNLKVSYTDMLQQDSTRMLVLDEAYVTRRGSISRLPVYCENLECFFDYSKPLAFTFSTRFRFDGVSYSIYGSFEDAPMGEGVSMMRCTQLRLSDKTLRRSEYQSNPR